MTGLTKREIHRSVDQYIAGLQPSLWALNQTIHQNPELAYKEHHAHDAICDFLESQSIPVTRHIHGLNTAFEAVVGDVPGRCVNFNVEYDALPDIGHACGHNLIATASVTGFMALAFSIREFGFSALMRPRTIQRASKRAWQSLRWECFGYRASVSTLFGRTRSGTGRRQGRRLMR